MGHDNARRQHHIGAMGLHEADNVLFVASVDSAVRFQNLAAHADGLSPVGSPLGKLIMLLINKIF